MPVAFCKLCRPPVYWIAQTKRFFRLTNVWVRFSGNTLPRVSRVCCASKTKFYGLAFEYTQRGATIPHISRRTLKPRLWLDCNKLALNKRLKPGFLADQCSLFVFAVASFGNTCIRLVLCNRLVWSMSVSSVALRCERRVGKDKNSQVLLISGRLCTVLMDTSCSKPFWITRTLSIYIALVRRTVKFCPLVRDHKVHGKWGRAWLTKVCSSRLKLTFFYKSFRIFDESFLR